MAMIIVPSLTFGEPEYSLAEELYKAVKQYVKDQHESGQIYDYVAYDKHQIIYTKKAKGKGFELFWKKD